MHKDVYLNELQILVEIQKAELELEGFPKLISAGDLNHAQYVITNRFKMSLQEAMNIRK